MISSPLQNPWVVSAIAVIAAGAVYIQFGDRIRRMGSRPPAIPPKAGTVVTVPRDEALARVKPVAGVVPVESTWGIDLVFVNQRFRKWMEAPNRDPFGQYPKPGLASPNTVVTNASDILWVSAIWRQSGERLAIINELVANEGSEILGYRINKIEADVIRVLGARGLEEVRIPDFDSSTATNLNTRAREPARVSTAAAP